MSGFRVMAEKCETCIFRPGNPMHLRSGRVRDMVEECERKDTFITCHETMPDGYPDERSAACRGYLDTGAYPQMFQIAGRLGMVEEVTGR